MGEPFTVQARCGAVVGSVSVQCTPESTVDEVLDRMLRCQGASTSAPDVVSFSFTCSDGSISRLQLVLLFKICHGSKQTLRHNVHRFLPFLLTFFLVCRV